MWWSEGRGREGPCVLQGELVSSVGYNPTETPPGRRRTARGHRPSQLGPICLSSAWESLTSGSLQGPGHVPWAALCLCSLEGVCSKAELMTERCSLVPTKSTGPDLPVSPVSSALTRHLLEPPISQEPEWARSPKGTSSWQGPGSGGLAVCGWLGARPCPEVWSPEVLSARRAGVTFRAGLDGL